MLVWPRAFKRGIRFCPTRPAAPVSTIFCGAGIDLDLEPLEYEPRQTADDRHDDPPEPRCVNHAAIARHRALHVGSDPIRGGPQRPTLLDTGGHRRVDESWLDRDDAYCRAIILLREPLQKRVERAFGCAVDEVACASAIARNRPNP